MWTERCLQDLKVNREYDADAVVRESVAFTYDWIAEDQLHVYRQQPRGNSIAVAQTLFDKYKEEVAKYG